MDLKLSSHTLIKDHEFVTFDVVSEDEVILTIGDVWLSPENQPKRTVSKSEARDIWYELRGKGWEIEESMDTIVRKENNNGWVYIQGIPRN